jgi:drug/metabolite transporter (DMT)-like permease
MTSRRKKVFWVAFALIAGALEPIVAKYSYGYGLHPPELFVIRNIAAALVLSPFITGRRAVPLENALKVLPVSLLLMATGFCTLLALDYLTAVTVITIATTTPAVVAILNQRLGREVLAKYFWPGFVLCFVGVLLSLDLKTFSSNPIGLIAVVLAVFTSSFYRVKMEELTDVMSPIQCSAVCWAFIGLFSLPGFAFVPMPPHSLMPVCAAIGISAAVANVSFVTAMTKVGAARISIITMSQRPLLIIFAAIVLREQPTWIQIIGIVMVMIGMIFAKTDRIEESHPVETEATSVL